MIVLHWRKHWGHCDKKWFYAMVWGGYGYKCSWELGLELFKKHIFIMLIFGIFYWTLFREENMQALQLKPYRWFFCFVTALFLWSSNIISVTLPASFLIGTTFTWASAVWFEYLVNGDHSTQLSNLILLFCVQIELMIWQLQLELFLTH